MRGYTPQKKLIMVKNYYCLNMILRSVIVLLLTFKLNVAVVSAVVSQNLVNGLYAVCMKPPYTGIIAGLLLPSMMNIYLPVKILTLFNVVKNLKLPVF